MSLEILELMYEILFHLIKSMVMGQFIVLLQGFFCHISTVHGR